ncbi:tRNA (guanosine(46)-N7)-methyltransferase TrmB [Erysipelotrichaceae bacterium OttesenSCG-928-M19]|nr:tRNA (guanosine(46)-N7)-methyltransferase TrmB [Erysipelotrichaceae bacterium OttesenSCG-928-M19]
MRLRNNPQANKILNESKYVINSSKDKYFVNNNPLHLEIGMGKGDFIIGMAKKYPHINFIGVEKFATVLVYALKKIETEQLTNVLLLNEDALNLENYFKPQTIATIYLNFSDPWPKSRHYKRRLTYRDYLKIYQKILVKDGFLKQKTDNKLLFESSILSFNDYGTNFEMISVDLHQSKEAKDNVMSEYEKKFSRLGQPIYAITISFKKGSK